MAHPLYIHYITTTNINRITAEINDRIGILNRCYQRLKDMLKTRHLKKETKSKPCSTKIKPVLIYACESRTLTKGDEQN
jgi:hypothetical protein